MTQHVIGLAEVQKLLTICRFPFGVVWVKRISVFDKSFVDSSLTIFFMNTERFVEVFQRSGIKEGFGITAINNFK